MMRRFGLFCAVTILCAAVTLGGTRALAARTVTGKITPYPLGDGVAAAAITAAPDGSLWMADLLGRGIVRVSTAGAVTGFLATPHSDDGPGTFALGHDGNLWFTEYDGTKEVGRIARVDTLGDITEYALPPGSYPTGIASGADGNIWFVDHNAWKIGRLKIAGKTSKITEFTVANGQPGAITAGPDGNLWFVECSAGSQAIGRITTAGKIREFPAHGSCENNGNLGGIVRGPNHQLWFADGGQIGLISLSGSVTEFAPDYNPNSITPGPDGNLWFVNTTKNFIGRITPAGVMTEFPTTFGQNPAQITVGPDGNLWVSAGSKVAKIT